MKSKSLKQSVVAGIVECEKAEVTEFLKLLPDFRLNVAVVRMQRCQSVDMRVNILQ